VCYQENLDYRLDGVRVRSLPSSVLWDTFLEYQKGDLKLSAMQLNRVLGGTLTSFRSGDYLLTHKRLH
jgi:transcription factor 1